MRKNKQGIIFAVVGLLRPFWPILALATLAGIASGLATAWLLAAINQSLASPRGTDGTPISAFVALFIVTFFGRIISDVGNTLIGQKIIAGLREDISLKILSAPIAELERFQSHRVLATLNQDIGTISSFTFGFSGFAISIAVTISCFVYLLWISPQMSLLALLTFGLGSLATAWARGKSMGAFINTREAEEQLQKHYRSIIEGAKELRMHRPRRIDVFHNKIFATTRLILKEFMSGVVGLSIANALGLALLFLLIGIVVFFPAGAKLGPPASISSFVLVLLYMKGPLEQIIGQLPMFTRAQIAVRRLRELSEKFENPEKGLSFVSANRTDTPNKFESIALRSVTFSFPAPPGGNSFVLGPVDLDLGSGEILFVTGENGGGKTTLIKLLLGLYMPFSGDILLNGQLLTSATLDAYRQLFATVFSDYFLFDELQLSPTINTAGALEYLERLNIADKVSIENGRFTTTDLSTGQRKRLALVHAWMEGRQILVFDEWAADQDPEFRRIFYTEILPSFKKQGRTVIAISHDDRYFYIADRRIVLRDGIVVGE